MPDKPNNITEVYPKVFVADGPTAGNLQLIQSLGITGVVNAALEFDYKYPSPIQLCRCGLHDEFPGCQENTDNQLMWAVTCFVRMRQEGKIVLSHCKAGHNRSGAIVVGGLVEMGVFPNVFEAYGRIAAERELHIQPKLLKHLSRLYPGNLR